MGSVLAMTNALSGPGTPSCARMQRGEFLSFIVGAEWYAMDTLKVQEIRCFEPPTRIVGAPSYLLGVASLRGAIVPVIDLRIRFGTHQPAYQQSTVVIVLSLADHTVGLVVDAVCDVVTLTTEDLHVAPNLSRAFGADSILGVATIEDAAVPARRQMLLLLDIERFVEDIQRQAV